MAADRTIKFAAIGLDHRHIYEQVGGLLKIGCHCVGFWSPTDTPAVEGFQRRYPEIPRADDRDRLLDDPTIPLIVTAGIPSDRADLAIQAMERGKDVMTDKPGCTSLEQLERLRATIARTGRIWSVCFSERFEVPAVERAIELVRQGRIGRVVHTVGLGPHRLNKAMRPDWFFDPSNYGGILTDIATHQIDQFLLLVGATEAEVVASAVGNFGNGSTPGLEDFGEILLRTATASGYIRVDWYTPDGLPTWGDGRTTILGTDGYIELRKYIDLEGRPGTDHLFMVDSQGSSYMSCADQPRTYYRRLVDDVLDRTATAMPQAHPLKVMEIALRAQATAARMGQ